MRILNSNVNHIRYTDYEEYVISMASAIIDDTRQIMRSQNCDLMYNTQTGEIITLDEFDRLAGILGGLANMDEILAE